MTKKSKMKFYPSAMTIAGSDSGGGAGIAADLRTFNAFGVFGTCAITAVTSQNPATVRRIDSLPGAAAAAQIETILEKIPVKHCKTGMLFSAEIIDAVFSAIKDHHLKLVCDPVMISTSGKKLLQDEAVAMLIDRLKDSASWITPNIPEAQLLGDCRITGIKDMLRCAAKLHETFSASIFLKGGHLSGNSSTDVIARDGRLYTLTSPLLDLPQFASHGTGCTLSAALTAMCALDLPWKQAVCESKAFVYGSLSQCVTLGAGITAMYPPTEDSIQLIKLDEAEL
ncbi:MAG: bifunctional hydroxymethylpyrimidine kinase/phosphomethylpyrimidine kinase [Lentisphaeria bacterium]|nr:bifunctional hydroxymethylpyrimidine kinase/phosphomethylpyrimidine kinase [Lentisphaeria bacterium]